MANMISLGMINVNLVQQNSGVFLGQVNVSGWDAHQKLNIAQGAMYGIWNVGFENIQSTFDGFEMIDGMILDQDIKTQFSNTF